MKTPVVIFTNFFDANFILQTGYIKVNGIGDDLEIIDIPKDSKTFSVALSQPKGYSYPTLKFFCPTWPILTSYKSNKDWGEYTSSYKELLRSRKTDVLGWINNLKNDETYILCCWENTCNGVNCHRRIIYEALRVSKKTKDKAIYLYRHCNEK